MAKQKIAPDENVGKNIAALMAVSTSLNSQPALAARTGVAQSTIGRILRNEVNASADTIHKIGQAFDTDVAALFMEHDRFMQLLQQSERPPRVDRSDRQPVKPGIREMVEGLAVLARPQRPTLRKTLSSLLVDLIDHPDDAALIEQTITDIEKFFGPES